MRLGVFIVLTVLIVGCKPGFDKPPMQPMSYTDASFNR